ncbi:CGGC domain-containing protein [Pseudodesulfovibrio senegalensis]|uniref:CGGC domain-containing protein n=1 Tax=Pseudodesulfovibrio senegalensis TaxID=1721087 RepID=A0A6N6N0M4_9BACT|nr:CGGC domain-containing protein [Pseudodesulfovibrio senegalensis]KAB1440928.1 CGGC domain-containing protein [Pseudodesulfovibrio senegalensis]
MTKIGIIRCEKNEERCPMTNCLKCLMETREGFADYEECVPVGVFTCRCPGDNFSTLVRTLKAKGAEVVHVPTCSFANKQGGEWFLGDGLCMKVDDLLERAANDADIPVVKGTAHLPRDYQPEVVK